MTIIKSYSTNNQWSGLRQPLTLILTISPSINLKTVPSAQPAKKITLEELPTLQVNQKVNVTASISLGNEKPKPVQLKATKEMTSVKEDCVLEDETWNCNYSCMGSTY